MARIPGTSPRRIVSPWWSTARILVALAIADLGAAACQAKDEPRPAAARCRDGCSWANVPAGAEPNASGASGASGGEPGPSVDVEGRLYWLDSRTLANSASRRFTDDSSVSMVLAETQTLTSIEASNGTFSLRGVLADDLSLVVAQPASASLGLPTISWVDTLQAGEIVVPVASADALDAAFSVVSTPVARNVDAAQVILQFSSQGTGAGIPGITIESSGRGKVIYDVGSTWTDADRGSGARGLVLIENLPVAGVGLQSVSLRFTDGDSRSEGLGILAASGMVTYFEAVLED